MTATSEIRIPETDLDWRESCITEVTDAGDAGWSITCEDGWSLFVPRSDAGPPGEGDVARFYGRGIGYPVRGLTVGGRVVFYESESGHERKMVEDRFGLTAQEWLDRWDSDGYVWSISMGGLGPGYEQAIQITAAEILRGLLAHGDKGSKATDAAAERTNYLGLSGAQWGAAMSLAHSLWLRGPIRTIGAPDVSERLITVERNFPRAPESEEVTA